MSRHTCCDEAFSRGQQAGVEECLDRLNQMAEDLEKERALRKAYEPVVKAAQRDVLAHQCGEDNFEEIRIAVADLFDAEVRGEVTCLDL